MAILSASRYVGRNDVGFSNLVILKQVMYTGAYCSLLLSTYHDDTFQYEPQFLHSVVVCF